MLLSKKDAQGSYYWAQKKCQQEKIKIEGVAFISKKALHPTPHVSMELKVIYKSQRFFLT